MIAIIRIHGQVGLNKDVVETFKRFGLKRKYSCAVLENPGKEQLGMIKKIKDFVAYGDLSEETYKKLVEAPGDKSKKIFRLHPPRGGIDSKKNCRVRQGVLGNNKKMDELVGRML